jgi:hypothetical protein
LISTPEQKKKKEEEANKNKNNTDLNIKVLNAWDCTSLVGEHQIGESWLPSASVRQGP